LMNESGVRHHLPRAATLPPVRGLPPIEDDLAPGAGRSLVLRDLDPDRLFRPRPSYRDSGSGVVRGVAKFLIASAVAAPTAYYVANYFQDSDKAPVPEKPAAASFDARHAGVMPSPRRQASEPARIPDEIAAAPAAEPVTLRGIIPTERVVLPTETRPAEPADSPVVEAAVASEPPPSNVTPPLPDAVPANAVAASNPPPRNAAPPPRTTMSAQEIAVLVERGRMLFEAGDLAAARLFFRRAANAGDAAAALAMGATYDPEVLAKRLVRGMGADLEEARVWYEKARELGSPEGPRRLETLLAHR